METGLSDRYVEALLNDDEKYLGWDFDTIYIGGGTPSCLSNGQLDRLLSKLVERHGRPIEFTIECNPEDVDENFASTISEYGVNRVSLGGQTTDDDLLARLGRKHRFSDVEKSVSILRRHGIKNISVDFIYGLMGQTLDDIEKDLLAVKELDIPHTSFYSLQIEPNTMLRIQDIQEPDPDFLADCYSLVTERLKSYGLERYEVSNFAKAGYQSLHNKCYWKANPFAAIGMGATSFEDGIRASRTKSIYKYISGDRVWNEESEDQDDLEFEFVMLNLRLAEGFSLNEFGKRFGKDFLVAYEDNIKKVSECLAIEGDIVKVKDEYLYTLDSILVDLLNF